MWCQASTWSDVVQKIPIQLTQQVDAQARYEVWVGAGILSSSINAIIDRNQFSNILVIAEPAITNIEALVGELTQAAKFEKISITESGKNTVGVAKLWRLFLAHRLDRKSLVITIGGGALSDTVGFAASTFMRGVATLNCPTTLLSQADAAVGGKTGVNVNGVKNLVGTFAQPIGVIVDVETLHTLPAREFYSGFAEIIKHGVIEQADDLALLQQQVDSHAIPVGEHLTKADDAFLVELLTRTIQVKARIVSADPLETVGLRKLLNFGHTLGHAIEALSHEGVFGAAPLLHGEAVALGMVGETFLSVTSGRCDKSALDHVEKILQNYHLPVRLSQPLAHSQVLHKIGLDKKNENGSTKWTLLNRLGRAVADQEVSTELTLQAIDYLSGPLVPTEATPCA